jgi:hypothetical protein
MAHREWVRHDLTDAGWRVRGVIRVLVQVCPAVVVFALLPGPLVVHLGPPLFLLLASTFVAAAYGDDLRDRRLRQHGLPVPPRDQEGPRGGWPGPPGSSPWPRP